MYIKYIHYLHKYVTLFAGKLCNKYEAMQHL